jgi:chorismate mutase
MKSLLPLLALRLLSLSLLALPVTVCAANLSPPASPVTAQAAMAESALTQVLVLMDARLKLAPDVARYKWNTQGAIEDRLREDKIIAALGQQAAQAGLPPDWAERFFRAQIEASKAIQFALFAQWQQQDAGPFAQVPDLPRETRPKLDRLTPHLLQALAAAWPLLCNATPQDEIAARIRQYWATAEHRPAVTELASAPLLAACP